MDFGSLAGGMSAGLLGGIGSYFGQQEANRTNTRNAREANRLTHQMAVDQMNFQERMSNTAHRREIADLKAAGLNPLLSATGGNGASSPAGAAGTAIAPTVENAMTGLSNSAKEGAMLMLQAQKQKEELNNLRKTNELLSSQKAKTDVEAKVMSRGIPKADLTNKFYKLVEPYVNKITNSQSTNARKEFNILTGRKP